MNHHKGVEEIPLMMRKSLQLEGEEEISLWKIKSHNKGKKIMVTKNTKKIREAIHTIVGTLMRICHQVGNIKSTLLFVLHKKDVPTYTLSLLLLVMGLVIGRSTSKMKEIVFSSFFITLLFQF